MGSVPPIKGGMRCWSLGSIGGGGEEPRGVSLFARSVKYRLRRKIIKSIHETGPVATYKNILELKRYGTYGFTLS